MTGFVDAVVWVIVASTVLLSVLGLVLLAYLLIFDRLNQARERRAALKLPLKHTEPFDEFFARLEQSFRKGDTR